ncbi:hypothetical protein, partial [Salmonella enterica]|uniref:hypothetical protein n=1 Tax=Salmonella enterica TaxID=28901 RepID=UPI0020C4D7E6
LILKQAKLEAVTLQIQNTELVKRNQNLQDELKKSNDILNSWTAKNPRVFDAVGAPSSKKRVIGEDHLPDSLNKDQSP